MKKKPQDSGKSCSLMFVTIPSSAFSFRPREGSVAMYCSINGTAAPIYRR
ncbi:MAG: hypothetical protein LBC47_02800 [Tannerella sp.]|nr:hypothetical protein [Tannerella sp.]